METINFVLRVLALIFLSIVFTKIFMCIANYIGEQLGFGKLFTYLLKKIRKKDELYTK